MFCSKIFLLDITKQRCLILGTDGVWNVLSPEMAVNTVRNAEKNNERHMLEGTEGNKTTWLNPSKQLVDQGVERWRVCKLRADNTSVVVVMLDPPGPPRAQVLKKQREANAQARCNPSAPLPVAKKACDNSTAPPLPPKPQPKPNSKGLAIISRFPNSKKSEEASGKNLVKTETITKDTNTSSRVVHDSSKTEPTRINVTKSNKTETKSVPDPSISEPQPSTSSSVPPSSSETDPDIQVNEISSSDTESPSAEPRTAPPLVPAPSAAPKPIQTRKSLSRELASLALDSPAPKLPARGRRGDINKSSGVTPRRRGRSIDNTATGRDNESDEENGGGARRQNVARPGAVQSHRSVATVQTGTKVLGPTKLDEVEAKCDALSNKLRLMERKVADRTDKLSQEVKDIKSKLVVSTPTRVLRSRNGEEAPSSGTKRKRIEQEKEEVKGGKRERTTTWSGLLGSKAEKTHQKSTRVTRKSTGALAIPAKGRRSLNILKK